MLSVERILRLCLEIVERKHGRCAAGWWLIRLCQRAAMLSAGWLMLKCHPSTMPVVVKGASSLYYYFESIKEFEDPWTIASQSRDDSNN